MDGATNLSESDVRLSLSRREKVIRTPRPMTATAAQRMVSLPPPDKMASLEVVCKRLGRGETNKDSRMKLASNTRCRRAIFDVPR